MERIAAGDANLAALVATLLADYRAAMAAAAAGAPPPPPPPPAAGRTTPYACAHGLIKRAARASDPTALTLSLLMDLSSKVDGLASRLDSFEARLPPAPSAR